MPLNITYDNSTYTVPLQGENYGWGGGVTTYLQALAKSLSPGTGLFPLSAELSFGDSFGIKAAYFKSNTVAPAVAGKVRLARTDGLAWRNAANTADLPLTVNASNELTFNGFALSVGLAPNTGLFQLTAELDFGSAFGIKALYYKSRTTNPASTGNVRLANFDSIAWRNNANTADLLLGVSSTNELTFNGTPAGAPPGSVMHFAGQTPPTGWLKRNGAAISRTTYPALYAIIGINFGAGDGSTTFNLPDDRGNFDRGWDDGRGVDAGRAFGSEQASDNLAHTHGVNDAGHVHTLNDAGHAHGVYDPAHVHGGVTDVQGNHAHNYTRSDAAYVANFAAGFAFATSNVGAATDVQGAHNHNLTIYASGTGVGIYTATTGITMSSKVTGITLQSQGSESRPRNRAYLPIIKY